MGVSGTFQALLGPSSGGDFYAEGMEHQAVIQTTHFGRVNSRVPSTAVALVCSGALIYVVLSAPTVVSFGLAVALAVAWCRWLESHPSNAAAGETRRGCDTLAASRSW